MTHQGKSAVIEDAFLDAKSKPTSRLASRVATPAATPPAGTPAGSGNEGPSTPPTAGAPRKKKKLTRNQMKAKEERKRQRLLEWLTKGGPRPDSDSEPDI